MSLNIESLITDKLDIWSTTLEQRNTIGRGSNKKINAYGVQKLKELILELAVRGKLVEQDPKEESVSMLLGKIADEKEKLVKDKKIKRVKTLASISEGEEPYELPLGWKWVRLQTLTEYIQRGKGPRYSDKGKVRVISQKCIQWSGFDISPARFIDDDSLEAYQQERYIKIDDLLWNSTGTGTVGRVNKINFEPNNLLLADSHVTVIRLSHLVKSDFISTYLSSPNIQTRISSEHPNSLVTGTTKQVELNTSKVSSLLVPIAPQGEQIRIIEKVNKLIDLCSSLEEQVLSSHDDHQLLIESFLELLTNSKKPKEFSENWQLISEHFSTLFITEKSIESLNKTIVQLAITGHLVKQDPKEESASELLRQVSAEKERLISNKEITRPKALPPIQNEEKLFDLPPGWSWCRLGDIVSKLGSGSTPRGGKSAYTESGIPFLRSQNILNEGVKFDGVAFIPEETHEKMKGTKVFSNDILLNITGGSLGRSAIYPSSPKEANVSQHVSIIRLLKPIPPEYIHMLLLSPLVQKMIWDRQVGVAREGLSKKVLELFEIPLPPLHEMKRILRVTKELTELSISLAVEVRQSDKLKLELTDSILSKYLLSSNELSKSMDAKIMKISSDVSLLTTEFEYSKFKLGALLLNNEHRMDAKSLWEKSQLSLPEFYQCLKNEIEQGIINKPEAAEYSEK